MNDNISNWYAVIVRPRSEKKISEKLKQSGIEYYAPLQKEIRQWSDRKKIILQPVFKGYIFLKISEKEKWSIKNIQGIVNYVYHSGKPAVIREQEILTIRKFLNEFSETENENKAEFILNTRVKVMQGILMNYEGTIIEISGNKAKININSLGLAITAHLNKTNLEQIM